MKTKTLIIRLMYLSVGLAGLMTAIIILISPGGNAVGKGISTAFLIFLADGFILLGLLAKHEWLKIGTRIASIYSLVVATIYTWMPKSDYSDGFRQYDAYGLTRNNEAYEKSQVMAHWMWGGYILAVIFVLVVLFSGLRAAIDTKDKIMNYSYQATLFVGIASGFVLALCASIGQGGLLLRFGFALLFLALTAATITGISLIVASIKRGNERREEQVRKYHEYQNANPGASAPRGYPSPQQGYGNQVYGGGYPHPHQYPAAPPQHNISIPPIPQAPPTVQPIPQPPTNKPTAPPYPPEPPAPPAPPVTPPPA